MMQNKRIWRLRVGDVIVIGVVLLLAVGTFVGLLLVRSTGGEALYCQISQNNEVIAQIPLGENRDQTIYVGGTYENTVEIVGDRVRVQEATCPNQLCVGRGWMRHPHETIACLPNHLLVKIVSLEADEADLDGVTGRLS